MASDEEMTPIKIVQLGGIRNFVVATFLFKIIRCSEIVFCFVRFSNSFFFQSTSDWEMTTNVISLREICEFKKIEIIYDLKICFKINILRFVFFYFFPNELKMEKWPKPKLYARRSKTLLFHFFLVWICIKSI